MLVNTWDLEIRMGNLEFLNLEEVGKWELEIGNSISKLRNQKLEVELTSGIAIDKKGELAMYPERGERI